MSAPLSMASSLFAGELALSSKNGDGFKTPFGTFGADIVYIGTLIDIVTRGNEIAALHLSDPTGSCIAALDLQNPAHSVCASQLSVPSFVYVYGTMRFKNRHPPEIAVSYLAAATRNARTQWILQTADTALTRLALLPSSAEKTGFLQKLTAALESIRPAPPVTISDDEILTCIVGLYEGRSAPKDRVLEELKKTGMTAGQAAETIARLIEQGDCYAPKPGQIKAA